MAAKKKDKKKGGKKDEKKTCFYRVDPKEPKDEPVEGPGGEDLTEADDKKGR